MFGDVRGVFAAARQINYRDWSRAGETRFQCRAVTGADRKGEVEVGRVSDSPCNTALRQAVVRVVVVEYLSWDRNSLLGFESQSRLTWLGLLTVSERRSTSAIGVKRSGRFQEKSSGKRYLQSSTMPILCPGGTEI